MEPSDALLDEHAGDLRSLALFEGPALFGVVVCFLAHQFGALAQNQIWLANCWPVLGLIAVAGLTLPTPARMRSLVVRLQQEAQLRA